MASPVEHSDGAGDEKIGIVVDVDKAEIKRLKRERPDEWKKVRKRLKKADRKVTSKDIAHTIKGADIKAKFLAETPALERFITDVENAVKRREKDKNGKKQTGWLRGLDGRRLPIRSYHAAPNTLIQSLGGVVMKAALVQCDHDLRAAGYLRGTNYAFVLNVHDEFQIECDEDIAEDVARIAADAIEKAGETYGLKCPLSGGAEIGNDWSETH